MFSPHREIVNPAPMPVIAPHNCRYDFAIHTTDKKHLWLYLHLPLNVAVRIVPCNDQTAIRPQPNDIIFIFRSKGSYIELHLSHPHRVLAKKEVLPAHAAAYSFHLDFYHISLCRHTYLTLRRCSGK
jgi:hypothetical protein